MNHEAMILDLQQQVADLQDKVNELVIRHNQEANYHQDCRARISQYYRAWWFRVWVFLVPPTIQPWPHKVIFPLHPADNMPILLDENPLPENPTRPTIDPHAKPVKLRDVKVR